MEKLTLTGYLETLVSSYLSLEETSPQSEIQDSAPPAEDLPVVDKKPANESEIINVVEQLEKDFVDLLINPNKEKK